MLLIFAFLLFVLFRIIPSLIDLILSIYLRAHNLSYLLKTKKNWKNVYSEYNQPNIPWMRKMLLKDVLFSICLLIIFISIVLLGFPEIYNPKYFKTVYICLSVAVISTLITKYSQLSNSMLSTTSGSGLTTIAVNILCLVICEVLIFV